MKRPKDILSQPYHIQEYINYLERKNESLHDVSCSNCGYKIERKLFCNHDCQDEYLNKCNCN